MRIAVNGWFADRIATAAANTWPPWSNGCRGSAQRTSSTSYCPPPRPMSLFPEWRLQPVALLTHKVG